MVKFKGKCAPIEQDEPFEEQAVAGRMKQNLLFFRNLSSGQKMCARFGKRRSGLVRAGGLPARSPTPKSTAAEGEGPLRKAPPLGTEVLPRKAPL